MASNKDLSGATYHTQLWLYAPLNVSDTDAEVVLQIGFGAYTTLQVFCSETLRGVIFFISEDIRLCIV